MSMPRVATQVAVQPQVAAEQRKADAWYLGGCLVTGSMLLGALGAIPLFYGFYKQCQLVKRGLSTRPLSVIVVGGFVMIDASLNTFPWGISLFGSQSIWTQTFLMGYGHIADAGYFIDYNARPFPALGVEPTTEKIWVWVSVLMIFPMRIGAAWAFMNFRSWGLHFLKVTSWLYLAFWLGYAYMLALDFEERIRPADFGLIGFWLYNLFYFTPMITLPYYYTVNRKRWNR